MTSTTEQRPTKCLTVSVTVTRVFEINPASYSDDGVTPEPDASIVEAELEALILAPEEFLEMAIEQSAIYSNPHVEIKDV